jgi:hypothetical protein
VTLCIFGELNIFGSRSNLRSEPNFAAKDLSHEIDKGAYIAVIATRYFQEYWKIRTRRPMRMACSDGELRLLIL